MEMPLVVSKLAQSDMDSLQTRISQDNPAAAFRVIVAVRRLYDQIARWPRSGRLLEPPEARFAPVPGYSDYIVIWTVEQQHVEILRVFHGHFDHNRALREFRP